MLKICGKAAESLGKAQRKTMKQPSTVIGHYPAEAMTDSAKAALLHMLFEYYPRQLSTALKAISSLIEHYFYPVSTIPTITNTKEKLKKGSI